MNLNSVIKPMNKIEYDHNMILSTLWFQNLGYEKEIYRLANFWFSVIPKIQGKVRYLEVGTQYGASAVSVAETYCKNNDSEVHCVDAWDLLPDSPEGGDSQRSIYNHYLQFTKGYPKIITHKGLSSNKLLEFPKEYFDLIYIDSNENDTYENIEICMGLLKKGGYLVVDDIDRPVVLSGINTFITRNGVNTNYEILMIKNYQMFIRKKGNDVVVGDSYYLFEPVQP